MLVVRCLNTKCDWKYAVTLGPDVDAWILGRMHYAETDHDIQITEESEDL
jgi:hypothetical protein